MKEGMLWYDNNMKASLSQRIMQAVEYYRQKYGKAPTACLVHPNTLQREGSLAENHIPVIVKPASYVLPNHFWLGVEEGN